jgi:hypothetical protein
MSQDAERTAIQRESQARSAALERTGITATPQSALRRPPQADDGVQRSGVSLLQRLPVLGAGLAVGAAFGLFVAGPMMPSGMRFADRVLIWSSVMGGPVVGTAWGMAEFHPSISLGWLGLLLILAHPIRPSVTTGCVTVFGLSLWFFAAFLAMMVAVWGA